MPFVTIHPEWVGLLRDFSRRNAGRKTLLEIDDPELGAQWQEADCALRGVGYDTRSGRLEIMLEECEECRAHLTHSIEAASEVDVLPGGDGRDRTLRIGHPSGQTLLTLVDA